MGIYNRTTPRVTLDTRQSPAGGAPKLLCGNKEESTPKDFTLWLRQSSKLWLSVILQPGQGQGAKNKLSWPSGTFNKKDTWGLGQQETQGTRNSGRRRKDVQAGQG